MALNIRIRLLECIEIARLGFDQDFETLKNENKLKQ